MLYLVHFFLVIFYLRGAWSAELLRLLVVPDDVNVTEVGQTFLFACTAASTDGSVAIMWLHNGLAVHNASGVRTHHSTQLEGDLTIASSVLELCVTSHVHIGGYSCEVHQEQQQQQEKAHFQVRALIEVSKSPPSNVTVMFGTEETFLCEFVSYSNSQAEVTWMINDRKLSSCSDVITNNRSEGDTVVITSSLTASYYSTPLFSGEYVCIANTLAQASFVVQVLGPTYIAHSPPVLYFDNINSTIILVCVAMGYGDIQLEWKYDGMQLSEDQQGKVNSSLTQYGSIQVVTSMLRLCPARSSEGRYTCVGSAALFNSSPQSPTTSVCSKPGSIGLLIHPEARLRVRAGSIHLACVGYSTGDKNVVVKWHRGNSTIGTSGRIFASNSEAVRGNLLLYVSLLTVPCMSRHDEGEFICSVSNGSYTQQAATTLALESVDVKFYEIPKADLEVEVSSAASLYCVASGNPTPTITWLKNGEPVNKTNNIVIQEKQSLSLTLTFVNSSLTFLAPSREDSGSYWCVASNVYSKAEFKQKYNVKVQETTIFDGAATDFIRPRGGASSVFLTGPVVCIGALLVVLVVHCLSRDLRLNLVPLLNFCTVMSLMCLFSALSSSDFGSSYVCTSFSALLHVFVIAAAMAIPNLIILRLDKMNKLVRILFLLLNWILPVAIVLSSVMPNINEYNGTSCHPRGWALWLGLILPLGILTGASWLLVLLFLVGCSKASIKDKERPSQNKDWMYHVVATAVILLLFDLFQASQLAIYTLSSHSIPSAIFSLALPVLVAVFSASLGMAAVFFTFLLPSIRSKIKEKLCASQSSSGTNATAAATGPAATPDTEAEITTGNFKELYLDLEDGDVLDEETEL